MIINTYMSKARFSKAQADTFRAWKTKAKISNLMIRELFYSHILDMNWGSIQTRSFRHINFSVFRYRWIKNGFTSPKSLQYFQEMGPRTLFYRLQMIQILWISKFTHKSPKEVGSSLKQTSIPRRRSCNTWSKFLAIICALQVRNSLVMSH